MTDSTPASVPLIQCAPGTPGAPRGVHADYCPTCGAWAGAACLTPSGRARDDHESRRPDCNARGAACNKHGRKRRG